MSFINKIYLISPSFLKNVFVSFYGIMWYKRRYGEKFHSELPFIIEREGWDRERFEKYQLEKLKSLIKWSYENVPFYNKRFKENNLRPEDIKSLEDLKKIPYLKREDIRIFGDNELLARNIKKRKLNIYSTSGSTYSPIKIAYAPGMHSEYSAYFEARCRRWAGVSYKDPRSTVGGRLIIPKSQKKPPFWVYNIIEKQLYLSSLHISKENIKYYAKAFERYRPVYQCGYSNAIYLIAKFLKEENIEIPNFKAVLTSSENLYESMRKEIESVFGCKVFDAYSGVEACCLASECEYQRMHISPEVGIIEIIKENGDPAREGEVGQIVATGLLNFAQPLIRYETGDLASFSYEKCPCGRDMPILKNIEGRIVDIIKLPDGTKLVPSSLLSVFYEIKSIVAAQIIQEEIDSFVIKIIPSKEFSKDDENMVLKKAKEKLGDVKIIINLVDNIQKSAAGKLKPVISKINE